MVKSIIALGGYQNVLAWSEELITDVRKPEIAVMTSLWAEAIY